MICQRGSHKLGLLSHRSSGVPGFSQTLSEPVSTTDYPEVQCLMNPAVDDGHWITIRLEGTQSNRFGIGARVEAIAGDMVYVGEVITTTSAFTAVHPQVHFGLGDATTINTLTVRWPSGAVTRMTDLDVDQVLTIREE